MIFYVLLHMPSHSHCNFYIIYNILLLLSFVSFIISSLISAFLFIVFFKLLISIYLSNFNSPHSFITCSVIPICLHILHIAADSKRSTCKYFGSNKLFALSMFLFLVGFRFSIVVLTLLIPSLMRYL